MNDEYWTVTLRAFAFESQEQAVKFRLALEDAFEAMPEAEHIGCSTTVHECSDEKEPKE